MLSTPCHAALPALASTSSCLICDPGDKAAQQGKDYWVDDSKCKACYECETPFSVFVRRHHCRICGRIFCSSCTFNAVPAPRDAPEQTWLRVCNYCECSSLGKQTLCPTWLLLLAAQPALLGCY